MIIARLMMMVSWLARAEDGAQKRAFEKIQTAR